MLNKINLMFRFLFALNVQSTVCFGDFIPRLVLYHDDVGDQNYPRSQNHTVFFQPEDSDDLYVGGNNFVYRFSLEHGRILETFPLNNTGGKSCEETVCEHTVTVIQQLQDGLFVCGTNGDQPQCWKLYPHADNQTDKVTESCEGTGISPYSHSQNSLSLTVEDDLYVAAPLYRDGSLHQFRRNSGCRTNMWMAEEWTKEPTYISASWIKRKEDPDDEKIYVFFREKNSDNSPDADPWISRIARVCKVDKGGPKRYFQNTWTSFLKARLVCGLPEESLYFNRLQDVFVQQAEDWRDSKVYALFTSSWNASAVCIYSLNEIDGVFQNSTFKGFNQVIPHPRPGTCVKNSRELKMNTLSVVKDHPEMNDWIHPIKTEAPFYISRNNYTKIAVDRVLAADDRVYSVLFLATDNGLIHKILEDEENFKPFIISEMYFSSNATKILSMKLDSKKRKLYVGLQEKMAVLDFQRCTDYNLSCADCVLSRDPYCAWSESGCNPVTHSGLQDIAGVKSKICPSNGERKRQKRDSQSLPGTPVSATYSVPVDFPFYLSCPVNSQHATYSLKREDQSVQCQQTQSMCLLLIAAMKEENYGTYECLSIERDYEQVMRHYQLNPNSENTAAPVFAHSVFMVSLSLTLLMF